ncbi:outer membrane beta-barrel protein [Larkinella terrae]|nr:outer membrane beta-barrel protein [Larkinella terrae]
MDTSYIWHLLYLHRKKSLAICLLLAMLAPDLRAQSSMKYRRIHLEDYDDKPIRYGFFFAAPATRFNIKYSDAYVSADSAHQLYSPSKVGFRVGFVMSTILSEHFDVRVTPAVSLYSRSVDYNYPGGTSRKEVRESTWLEFPVLLKYKSKRRMNSRMYLVGGGALGIETNVRRRETAGASRLLTKNRDLTVEYGIGFEQFFEFFKFAPEIRFSHGLVNLFEPNQGNTANIGLQKLRTHTVTLYLTFE